MTAFETPEHHDVLVIGGGPAGSTAAAILAEKGREVLVLEREKFPRYSVGESLMPYCYFTLERLGVVDRLKTSRFPKKYSVQFVSLAGEVSQPFYFFQHLKHEASTTWQVLRSEFDQMLLDNARRKGASVLEETTATGLVYQDGAVAGVRTVDKSGATREFSSPMTIDATGRAAFSANKNHWRIRDEHLNRTAIWTYYEGALRDPGLDEGATTIAYLPEKGWFWYIPLADNVVSVGLVAQKQYLFKREREPAAIFEREIGNNPWIKQHLAEGHRSGPYRVTGDYSYRSRYSAADGLILAGDSFAFLDPVFSSGIFLALKSGEWAADAVDEALRANDFSAARFEQYGTQLCRGIEAMRKLVYAFYDKEFSFRQLMKAHPDLRGDLTDCLIGNLFRDFGQLFQAAAELVPLPDPLDHGQSLRNQGGIQGRADSASRAETAATRSPV